MFIYSCLQSVGGAQPSKCSQTPRAGTAVFEIATAASGLAMTNTECAAMVVVPGRVMTRAYSSSSHFHNNDKSIVFLTVYTYEHVLICSCVHVFVCSYVRMFVCSYVHMFICSCVTGSARKRHVQELPFLRLPRPQAASQ